MRFNLMFFLLLISGTAIAQKGETRSISLAEALNMAQSHSYAIKKQNIEKAKLDDSYRAALGMALPQIKFESSLKHFIESPKIGGTFSLNKDYETGYGVTVSQAVYTFGAVSNALDAAKSALEIQGLSQDAVKREIEYATKMAYFGTLVAEKQLSIAETSLKNAKYNLNTLQKQFTYGRPPQSDLLRINTDMARKIPEVTHAKSNLKISQSRLKYLLGIDQNAHLVLTDKLEHSGQIKVSADMYKQLKNHPQILTLEKNILLQESIANIAQSANLPAIGAFYTWNRSLQSDEGIFKSENTTNTQLVGLSLNWSLWDGGTSRAKYQKALKEKVLAETVLAEAREQLDAELRVAIEEIPSLMESLTATRNALALAKKSQELSRRRFVSGKTSVLELNDSETVLTQLSMSESMVIFQLLETQAKIEKLTHLSTTKQVGGKH